MQYISYYTSPLGKILLSCDNIGLNGLWFEGQKYFAQGLDKKYLDKSVIEKQTPLLKKTKDWLDIYFSGQEPDFKIPFSFMGTPFQKEVWEILTSIPYGKTITYGDIAKKLAIKRGILKMSNQAVGRAIGQNKISIIVPCHRVIASNGSLTGYSGGITRKIKLLKLENAFLDEFFIPKIITSIFR